MTPDERAAVRARARARAERMGYRIPADQAPAEAEPGEEPVPTTNPQALRQLLNRGHLTPGQAARARRMFQAASQYARTHNVEGDVR